MRAEYPTTTGVKGTDERNLWLVAFVGLALVALLSTVSLVSKPFEYGSTQERPIIEVTLILMTSTLVSLLGLRFSLQVRRAEFRLIRLILLFAICLRLLFWLTTPILEIDYYRYIWDGKVSNVGVSPYRYSPSQVLGATAQESELQLLSELALVSESNYTILSRVHFEEYTTIYPPVTQCVFAIAMSRVPAEWTVFAHILAIKSVLVLFDLLTLGLLIGILRSVRRHPGWSIAYAWNPLVLKEVSNSGHADSIAVFFIVAALAVLVKQIGSLNADEEGRNDSLVRLLATSALAGGCLGFGVGAKLFPFILAPGLSLVSAKSGRNACVVFLSTFLVVSTICLAPMCFSHHDGHPSLPMNASDDLRLEHKTEIVESTVETNKEGLTGFLSRWRMNDVVFSGIYRNLRPDHSDQVLVPWYVITTDQFRNTVNEQFQRSVVTVDNPAFVITRCATVLLFVTYYLFSLRQLRGLKGGQPEVALHWALGVLACFLFLQPTCNPWYWLWAIPFTCFARNPGLASGIHVLATLLHPILVQELGWFGHATWWHVFRSSDF